MRELPILMNGAMVPLPKSVVHLHECIRLLPFGRHTGQLVPAPAALAEEIEPEIVQLDVTRAGQLRQPASNACPKAMVANIHKRGIPKQFARPKAIRRALCDQRIRRVLDPKADRRSRRVVSGSCDLSLLRRALLEVSGNPTNWGIAAVDGGRPAAAPAGALRPSTLKLEAADLSGIARHTDPHHARSMSRESRNRFVKAVIKVRESGKLDLMPSFVQHLHAEEVPHGG